jgi:hypothetical protein
MAFNGISPGITPVVASLHMTARRRFSPAAWKRKCGRSSATSRPSLGAGDTFVVGACGAGARLAADGVGDIGASGEATGWQPMTAQAANARARSIRLMRSV